MISQREKDALFIEIHRAIEDAATRTAAALRAGTMDLSYPPNAGLSAAERAALESLSVTPDLETALRKVIADASSVPLFRLFTLLDGVGDPEGYGDLWLGLVLSRPGEDEEPGEMLHDEFFESYWEWRKRRPDPGWKLDAYEG
jgi:hypothetical protein